jgi:hypothetical protein
MKLTDKKILQLIEVLQIKKVDSFTGNYYLTSWGKKTLEGLKETIKIY